MIRAEKKAASDFPSLLEDPFRARAELGVGWLPPDVRAQLDALAASGQTAHARFLFQALCLAGVSGAVPVRAQDGASVQMEGEQGPFSLRVLVFSTQGTCRGDVVRLESVLDSAFSGRRYLVHLRRPVPEGYDPEPIARAVHLWLAAFDRGEWLGRHAAYEDEQISLELTLLRGERPLRAVVGPTLALEQLALVDRHVIDDLSRSGDHNPVVVCLCALGEWRVPRGFTEQLLYGTATQVVVDDGYCATFRGGGSSLFADPAAEDLAGLWWLESLSTDPMGLRGWATENPWCRHGRCIGFPGARFEVRRRAADQGELVWTAPQPSVWRSA